MKLPAAVQLLQRGLVAHQQGQLAEAREAYQGALRIAPNNPDALHLLGVVLGAQGETDRGIELISRAVRLQPRQANFLFNLGNLFLQGRRFAEATKTYNTALALDPKMADAWENLGLALIAQGLDEKARESWQRSLALAPKRADVWLRLAENFREQGLLQEAEATYSKAASYIPGHVAILCNHGNILHLQSRFHEAATVYRQAVTLAPDSQETWNNLGIALQKLGQLEESVTAFEQSIHIKPEYADAYSNLAAVLQRLNRTDRAIIVCRQALEQNPIHSGAHKNLASSLLRLNQTDKAIEACKQAIRLSPTDDEAHVNLGSALQAANRLDEAIEAYAKAYKLNPSNAVALKNEGVAWLLKGDLLKGFRQYEARWEAPDFKAGRRDFGRPSWQGEPGLAGRSILLHAEQGLGDTLQFARYAPLLAQKGAQVFLEVPAPLLELLSNLPGLTSVFSCGAPVPATDFQSPLLSLPLALKTELGGIPADIPYLRPLPIRIARWQSDVTRLTGLKVGVVWSGNPNHKNDYNRSVPFTLFKSLFAGSDMSFVILQKDISTDAQPLLASYPSLHNWTAGLNHFSDTAGLIQHLDLIISVDTSVAHLAGAMGKPTWVLLPFAPDWRWMLNTDRSPWYPSMRLFRQPQTGDWETVLASVAKELAKYTATGR